MGNSLNEKNILIGISGGIAAYKTIELISLLKKSGANVETILTESGKNFVTPLTLQTMTGNKCHMDMFSLPDQMDPKHISLAKSADLILIAPATANIIGKIANGIADDFLTTVVMASRSPVVFAPAMNTFMYLNSILQANIFRLKEVGYEFIEPASGLLACGDEGIGKMESPNKIFEFLEYRLTKKDLKGKTVMVTAGPTIEDIDPVRFISNRSSGKMGYAIAKEVASRGAKTILVSGSTRLDTPYGVERLDVRSTQELFDQMTAHFESTDVLIMAAAPADFKPEKYTDSKIKKKNEKEWFLKLVENPDLISHFGQKKGDRKIIGFAAETDDCEQNALKKITKKNLDMIVLNDVSQAGAGFDVDTNIVTLMYPNGDKKHLPMESKQEIARQIVDEILSL